MEDKEAFFCCCIFASFQSQNSYTSVTRWVEVNSPDEGSETVEMGLWLWNDIKANHVRETWLLPTLCRKDAKWKQTHKNNVEKEQVKPVKVMFSKGKKTTTFGCFWKVPCHAKFTFNIFYKKMCLSLSLSSLRLGGQRAVAKSHLYASISYTDRGVQ